MKSFTFKFHTASLARMDEIQRAPNKVLSTKTITEDVLVQFLMNKLERTDLTDKLQEYVENMRTCAKLIRKYGSRLKVEPMLEKLFAISPRTARTLYDRTTRLYRKDQPPLDREFWIDIHLGDVRKGIKKALKDGDIKAYASLMRIQHEIIKDFMGTNDAAMYEQFEMPELELAFTPEIFKNNSLPEDLDAQIEKLKKSKKYKERGEYVEYEEV